jgi:hypothetical protein
MLVVRVINESLLRVIHYVIRDGMALLGKAVSSGSCSATDGGGEVKEEEVRIDLTQEKLEKLGYSSPGEALYTGQAAIDRARERVGETGYSLLFNNCESLVNWAITGKNRTNQGDTGLVVGAALTAGVVGAVAYGLYSLFSGGKNKERD